MRKFIKFQNDLDKNKIYHTKVTYLNKIPSFGKSGNSPI